MSGRSSGAGRIKGMSRISRFLNQIHGVLTEIHGFPCWHGSRQNMLGTATAATALHFRNEPERVLCVGMHGHVKAMPRISHFLIEIHCVSNEFHDFPVLAWKQAERARNSNCSHSCPFPAMNLHAVCALATRANTIEGGWTRAACTRARRVRLQPTSASKGGHLMLPHRPMATSALPLSLDAYARLNYMGLASHTFQCDWRKA